MANNSNHLKDDIQGLSNLSETKVNTAISETKEQLEAALTSEIVEPEEFKHLSVDNIANQLSLMWMMGDPDMDDFNTAVDVLCHREWGQEELTGLLESGGFEAEPKCMFKLAEAVANYADEETLTNVVNEHQNDFYTLGALRYIELLEKVIVCNNSTNAWLNHHLESVKKRFFEDEMTRRSQSKMDSMWRWVVHTRK